MERLKPYLACLIVVALFPSCKTRSDLRREEELKRLRAQIAEERSSSDADGQELKMEVSRLSGLIEELFQQNRALQNDLEAVNNRLKEVEAAKSAPPQPPVPKPVEKASFAGGKALFDKGAFSSAIEVLEAVLQSKPSLVDKKNSRYLLAEAYYANKQYGQAAIEYSQFKKSFPKDNRVAKSIYRQANCFRNLGKNKEAALFYQELLDGYPKSTYAPRARKELAGLK
ncbi:MAG: tetratricopeptide repeat protein [Bdellovibrionales bacterium]|nr:tetratricopeptide repeat protein [Bdellovibrionales bacterium]